MSTLATEAGTKAHRIHYAWLICAICLLIHFCNAGISTNGFSLYGHYLRDQLDFSNTEFSMLLTLRSFSSTFFLFVSDRYYKRFTLRQGVAIACLLLVAAFVGFSFSRPIWLFYFFSLLMGAAYSFGGVVPITLLFHNWFASKRFIATAIALCGAGVRAIVAPFGVTALVGHFGLANAFLMSGVLVALVAGAAYLFLRDAPQEMSLEPYQDSSKQDTAHKKAVAPVTLSPAEARLVLLAVLFAGCVGYPASSHMAIHYATLGYRDEMVAMACSFYGSMLTLGKFLFGVLADRFGTYRVNYLFLGCWITANVTMAIMGGNAPLILFAASILQGFGGATATVGVVVWISNLSSHQAYASSIKTSQTAFALGSLATTSLPGVIADMTGSYAGAYAFFSCLLAGILVIMQMIYHRHLKSAPSGKIK